MCDSGLANSNKSIQIIANLCKFVVPLAPLSQKWLLDLLDLDGLALGLGASSTDSFEARPERRAGKT